MLTRDVPSLQPWHRSKDLYHTVPFLESRVQLVWLITRSWGHHRVTHADVTGSCQTRTKGKTLNQLLYTCAYIFITAPLGSIPELPAQSCKEIKASEGKDTISSKYWLDLVGNGTAVLVYCDMNLEGKQKKINLSFYECRCI